MQTDWKIEIIRKLPWSATFLLSSFCFFKFTQYVIAGWICLVVAIIALFILIRFEYYENIIDRQESEIDEYRQHAMQSQKDATETISSVNTSLASGFEKEGYSKPSSETETE
jgi:hypothetical protein